MWCSGVEGLEGINHVYLIEHVLLFMRRHALKQATGRDYSKAAVMAMLVARAVAPVADLIERAVWEDRHGNLMPTQVCCFLRRMGWN